jgi:hypothetical protein
MHLNADFLVPDTLTPTQPAQHHRGTSTTSMLSTTS